MIIFIFIASFSLRYFPHIRIMCCIQSLSLHLFEAFECVHCVHASLAFRNSKAVSIFRECLARRRIECENSILKCESLELENGMLSGYGQCIYAKWFGQRVAFSSALSLSHYEFRLSCERVNCFTVLTIYRHRSAFFRIFISLKTEINR